MGNLSEIAKKDDQVQIYTAQGEGKVDPFIYRVTGFRQSIVELENVETGKFHRVHKTRIAKILVNDKDLEEVQKVMDKTAEKPKVKAKPKKQKPEKPERVDFKQMIIDGWEIWSKQVKFTDKDQNDIAGIKAEAHCAIAPDQKSYRVFNTYNGALGTKAKEKKKNPDGVSYSLADEKALEKKRKDLEKKSYKKRPKAKNK
jgi:hypothetical protein